MSGPAGGAGSWLPGRDEPRDVRLGPLRLSYTPARLGAVAVATVVYAALFAVLYPRVGDNVASFTVLPIAAAGWLLGIHGGLAAGAVFVLVNYALFVAFTPAPGTTILVRWPGAIIGLTVGGATGWVAELLSRLRAQARILAAEREDLRSQMVRRVEVETKLRAANFELSQARDRALAGTRAKSVFLANMSHELRTPLTSIIGYGELMLEEHGEAEGGGGIAADLRKIVAAGRHLLRLIDDLLDLSRIEAGKLPLTPTDVKVDELARDLADTVRPLADANGTRLVLEIEDDIGEIRADATRVRQILLNILGNAVKFTEGGSVTITATHDLTRSGEWFVFVVADTGTGMTPEQRDQLFAEFQPAPPSGPGRAKPPGAGLGLVITRRLCELMGGEIGVESEVGKGTTVTVVLPARPPSESRG